MLSPDGKYLFFTRGGDVYWVDAAILKTIKPGRAEKPAKSGPKRGQRGLLRDFEELPPRGSAEFP